MTLLPARIFRQKIRQILAHRMNHINYFRIHKRTLQQAYT